MRALALVLVLPLLAGCVSDERRSNDTCVNGVCEDRSFECRGDECEVCVDGECAQCERAECEACLEGGECPMLPSDDGEAADQAFPDVRVQQTYDLSAEALPRTTWTLDSAAGSTGHLRLELRDVVTGERVLSGGACFEYLVQTWSATGTSRQEGAQGDCGTGTAVQVGGSTTSSTMVLGDWTVGGRGHYEFALQAPMQPNELVVDFVIDNPPLQSA